MTHPQATENASVEEPAPALEVPEDKEPLNVKFTAVFMPRLAPSSKLDEFALAAMLAQSHRRKGK
jgi:hypothetical protein